MDTSAEGPANVPGLSVSAHKTARSTAEAVTGRILRGDLSSVSLDQPEQDQCEDPHARHKQPIGPEFTLPRGKIFSDLKPLTELALKRH
jgi:hypothetical protein